MRFHLVIAPRLHHALHLKVQIPAGGGWATIGQLHGSRATAEAFVQQLQRGAARPGDLTLGGRTDLLAPPALSSGASSATPSSTLAAPVTSTAPTSRRPR